MDTMATATATMDATKITTRPEGTRRSRRPLAWTLLGLALAIVTLSGDLLWHDVALYRLHAVAHAIRFGERVTKAQLALAASDAIRGDDQGNLNAADLDDAAQVVSLLADNNRGNAFLAPALLATSESLLRKRLALAPADGHSWLRLAYVRTARVGFDPLAHDALRESWLVTPREFTVMWPSLKFRIAHWFKLTVEEQFAAADLVAGLWHKPPEREAIRQYLAKLPPQLTGTLLTDMTDAEARAALSQPQDSWKK